MKNPIIIISTLLIGITIGYLWAPKSSKLDDTERANYDTLPYKIELIKAYDQYVKNAETLLDSIWEIDSYFEDVTVETDTYYEYELARERVRFLNNMEDNADITWENYYTFMQDCGLKPYQDNLKD